MVDHYAVLGVPRAATAAEIRSAYVVLARDRHPDRIRDDGERKKAVEFFKELTAAYDVLSRERGRRDYDARNPTAGSTVQRTSGPVSKSAAPTAAPVAAQPAAAPPRQEPILSGRVNVDALAQGLEAFKKQDWHTAVQLLNIAVTRDENNPRAHAFLGLALAKNPNWVRDGVHHLETAARLEPKNPSYPAELALLYHAQGLKLRARKALETAQGLNPNHPDVQRAAKEIPQNATESESGAAGATPSGRTGEVGRGILGRLRR